MVTSRNHGEYVSTPTLTRDKGRTRLAMLHSGVCTHIGCDGFHQPTRASHTAHSVMGGAVQGFKCCTIGGLAMRAGSP